MGAERRSGEGVANRTWLSARKVATLAAVIVVAVNIWTGAPLLAIWIGSRVQGGTGVSMGAIAVIVVALAVLVFVLSTVLAWLNARYDRLAGRPPPRQRYPWLQSLRDERQTEARRARGVTAVEKAVIGSVVAAILAVEIWFFFFAEYRLAP